MTQLPTFAFYTKAHVAAGRLASIGQPIADLGQAANHHRSGEHWRQATKLTSQPLIFIHCYGAHHIMAATVLTRNQCRLLLASLAGSGMRQCIPINPTKRLPNLSFIELFGYPAPDECVSVKGLKKLLTARSTARTKK
ncbi:hypothetical protein IHE33_15705 (plasmid) [Mycetohabitans endofungorum]|uniref:hypothetical protein n=1 Tax=Mycetohabitans endofungorum TaxID=417203 RepID=UPI0030D104C7